MPGFTGSWSSFEISGDGFFVSFFVDKHIVSPLKRVVNKHSVDRYDRNVFRNETLEYKRKLGRWDILEVTEKYGFVEQDDEYKDDHKVYSGWTYAGFTWYGVYFCDDGVRMRPTS